VFKNRRDAGFQLAQELQKHVTTRDIVILGIARGGAVVAKEVAQHLNISFDILVIRKIGAPQNPELAIGAVGPRKTLFWEQELVDSFNLSKKQLHSLASEKYHEVNVLEKRIRGNKKPLSITNKTIILVDDGVATGATVLCAEKYLHKQVSNITLAVPVMASSTLFDLEKHFNSIIAIKISPDFHAVGQFYEQFEQVDTRQIIEIVRDARKKN